jgi:hypothetical protein
VIGYTTNTNGILICLGIKNKIMKIIHQIYIADNNSPPPEYMQNQTQKLKNLYKDYQYNLYNNSDLIQIIKENFSTEVLEAYNTIKPYAFKADLARYCLLYLYGGYYWDITLCPEEKFEFEDEIVLIKGNKSLEGSNGLPIVENNFMFFKTPKNIMLLNLIKYVVSNIKWLHKGDHPLDITGPISLGKFLQKHSNNNIKYGQTILKNHSKYTTLGGKVFYNFKPIKATSDLSQLGAKGTNNYEKMWFEGNTFNYKFSFVVITNATKPLITLKVLKSILNQKTL